MKLLLAGLAIAPLSLPGNAFADSLPEKGRSLVAVPTEDGKVMVNWRLLAEGEKFDLFRLRAGELEIVKQEVTGTSFCDEAGAEGYELRKQGEKVGEKAGSSAMPRLTG